MPFSWAKVPSGTSAKVLACMGADHSKTRFSQCVTEIVEQTGGRVDAVWFELNGHFAHVHFYWDTYEQKTHIAYDLEATQVTDLITPEEADRIAADRS
jgi:hypothetical protein